MAMTCDLCHRAHDATTLLCDACADMMRRLVAVDQRMRTREVCEAERLAQSAVSNVVA
jgi:hypothetical protein